MKKLKHIRTSVFRREFTEKQMRAYFAKEDKLKEILMWAFILSAFFCIALIFFFPEHLLVWFCAAVVFCLADLVMLTILRFSILPPTDEEYDSWVKEKARESLREELRKLNEDRSEEEIEEIPYIHGFVLDGTKNAEHYRPQDLFWKWGKDHIQRYSINVFRYFLALKYQLAVIIIDINAVNHHDRRAQNQEFFFVDVVAVTTVDEHDTFVVKDIPHAYRTQSFELRICDGKTVSATIRSQPLDYEEKLDTFELPSSENVENTISKLRMLIRSRKQGPNSTSVSS